ncbi:MAG: hypothetical protein Kow006_15520 [Gammaproteobacteria bacterium]
MVDGSVSVPLPWLRRDHQRIEGLVEAVVAASRHSATHFVLHRLLEELRIAVHWHLDRLHHALGRVGLSADVEDPAHALLRRLAQLQGRLRRGEAVDRAAVVQDILRWKESHCAECRRQIEQVLSDASLQTRRNLLHADFKYPGFPRLSIPSDPQTSGTFMM